MSACVIAGCEAHAVGRGWCRYHYSRWQRTGAPMGSRPPRQLARCRICGGPADARRLCAHHYDRWRRYGDPLGERTPFDPVAAFWSKVDRSSGPDSCWPWTGSRVPSGYGHLTREGRSTSAHRVAYLLNVGPISAGLQIDHLCRNPPCVNPDHLELVTQRENGRRGIKGILTTHCPKGHAYDDANTLLSGASARRPSRTCRTCNRERCREYAKRRTVLALTAPALGAVAMAL